MGVASYNRGSRVVARVADEHMPEAVARRERHAYKDENARLQKRVAELERILSRARRCLASERHGREQLRLRLMRAERGYEFGMSVVCRLAFPGKK